MASLTLEEPPERNRALAKAFLATLPLVELDAASIPIVVEAKALLERRGQRLADADLLIGLSARGAEPR
jgi:predicted nucleic acid-binding protein